MNWILRKYIDKIYYIYTDDITIFSNSMEEYKVNIHLILEVFHEIDIIISIKKSSLFVEKIEFLGYIVSSDGLEVVVSKIEKILD
jgi:Reverse transcriptase (RNA-dependent DNA polymerase)